MRLLLMLSAMALLNGCAPAVSSRPCPRVTEFPADAQERAAYQMREAPDVARMMDAMAADRAYNRAVCPR